MSRVSRRIENRTFIFSRSLGRARSSRFLRGGSGRGFCLLLLTLAAASNAYALRCSHGLVHTGDTEEEVVEKCGAPAHQHGQKWFYGKESDFRVHEVLFVDRKVWRIRIVHPGT
ncbi:MAG: DUF2845 domain-containing protein [Gammaproteobacteria bacterium]|nr:DUF2845 domain-containing protein [Gammaproteobacteria bacterium]